MSEAIPGSAPKTVTVIGVLDSSGNAVALGGSARTTLVVESTRISKGYQQLTSTAAAATLASLCSGSVLPTGATHVEMIPSAAIHIRDDGTDPTATVGIPVGTNGWDYDRDQLAALKVYGAATIDCWFYA